MRWTEDLERLCGLDEHPDLRDATSSIFPDITVRYVLESIIPRIDGHWPEATQTAFRIAGVVAALGVVAYDQFTVSTLLAHQALETALRQRMEHEYPAGIPLTLRDGSVIACSDVTSFTLNRQKFRGHLADMEWFSGSFRDLLRWCQQRSYLSEDTVDRAGDGGRFRNSLVHASTESRLLPGMALRYFDFLLEVAREAWRTHARA